MPQLPADPHRELFGDERADYQEALDRHHKHGPLPDWEQRHVSAYATMHPWEDWAETFAHYLHIRDTLETAAQFGIVVGGPEDARDPSLIAAPSSDLLDGEFGTIIQHWLPFDLCAQRAQPQHGCGRPLSVRARRRSHAQAVIRARLRRTRLTGRQPARARRCHSARRSA